MHDYNLTDMKHIVIYHTIYSQKKQIIETVSDSFCNILPFIFLLEFAVKSHMCRLGIPKDISVEVLALFYAIQNYSHDTHSMYV